MLTSQEVKVASTIWSTEKSMLTSQEVKVASTTGSAEKSEQPQPEAVQLTVLSGQLNHQQLQAVQLACCSDLKFVMIQGPPGTYVNVSFYYNRLSACTFYSISAYNFITMIGTGKSMTGAHIAYALAVKLKRERIKLAQDDETSLNPCVMYCGPSQQSVNVVLGKVCVACVIINQSRYLYRYPDIFW